MDNSNDKSCKNCVFYLKHYIKTTHGYAETLGHCKNPTLYPALHRKAFAIKTDCKYWQTDNEAKKEFDDSVVKCIKDLVKRLNDVCEVLLDGSN